MNTGQQDLQIKVEIFSTVMNCISILMLIIDNILAHDAPLRRIRRLAGGSDAPQGSFPYIVSFQDKTGHFCAGTIVSDHVILTAAHCTFRNSFTIRVGSIAALSGGKIHQVARIIRHERYEKIVIENNTAVLNDLALIKVTPSMSMTENVHKIELFRRYESLSRGSSATLIGWGATRMRRDGDFENGKAWDEIKSIFVSYDKSHYYSETLKQANMTILSKKKCIGDHSPALMQNKICAYSPFANGCIGDSGGPLLVNGRQAGIMSSGGNVCASGKSRGIYVKVAHYRDWIDKKTTMLESTVAEDNSISF